MNNDTIDTTIGGIEPVYDTGSGGWSSLVARLTGAGRGRGYSVLTVQIIVDEHGNARYWTEPSVKRIEPRARGEELDALIRTLAE